MAEITTDAYSIRYATQADVSTILKLITELAIYEKAEHEVLATEQKLLDTLSFPASPDGSTWTAGVGKTLLLISHSTNSESFDIAQEVSAEVEVETSSNAQASSETVAGMALYFNNYSTWLAQPGIYLEDLFVRPAFRKKGYGKALLQALARECVDKDYGRLEWQVLRWNKPSIEFYVSEAVGAKSQGEEWDYMRVSGDALKKLAGQS